MIIRHLVYVASDMQPTNDDLVLVGRRVKSLRKARGLSQTELAKRADVDQKTISNIERAGGSQKSVTFSAITGVAKALGVPVWQLLLPVSDDASTDPRLSRVITHYASAPPDGQANIDRVAEMESRYPA